MCEALAGFDSCWAVSRKKECELCILLYKMAMTTQYIFFKHTDQQK